MLERLPHPRSPCRPGAKLIQLVPLSPRYLSGAAPATAGAHFSFTCGCRLGETSLSKVLPDFIKDPHKRASQRPASGPSCPVVEVGACSLRVDSVLCDKCCYSGEAHVLDQISECALDHPHQKGPGCSFKGLMWVTHPRPYLWAEAYGLALMLQNHDSSSCYTCLTQLPANRNSPPRGSSELSEVSYAFKSILNLF